ncbi:hypothetical protein B0J11DRAFT_612490 [Dendryphion nanum]|uniref:Rhodopsin domain-containing protein n=1 Tax=Dendryphion nanum TaxID=256645 RepID=A0A9P9IRD7_9PLEO|nr:hypothetical protein B0J11DRAFT_612490 [Dendryphion nanum]
MAPRTLQPSAIALAAVPTIISTLIVIIRVWKKIYDRRFAIEDGLLVAAQILSVVLMAILWYKIRISWYGYHYWDIPPGAINTPLNMKLSYAASILFNPILGLIKASFLITLIKLRSPNPRINFALWAIFAINAGFTLVTPFTTTFICTPINKAWDPSVLGKCLDSERGAYSTIGLTVLTDLMIVAMPTWILYKLQIPLKRKIMVICFLSFGLAVTAIGVYRLWVFWYFHNGFMKNKDALYSIRQGLSSLEVSLAAIGACGPTIKWILGLFIPFFADEDTRIAKSKRSDPSNSNKITRKRHENGDSVLNTNASGGGDEDIIELRRPDQAYKVPAWTKTSYRMRIRGATSPDDANADARSDEQRFAITKTTGWGVDSKNTHNSGRTHNEYEEGQIRPRDVV